MGGLDTKYSDAHTGGGGGGVWVKTQGVDIPCVHHRYYINHIPYYYTTNRE